MNDCIKGILITEKGAPTAVSIENGKKFSNDNNTNYWQVNIYGEIKEDTENVYLIYYVSAPGDVVVPNCVYTKEKDADAHLKYWNDDAGIMATGHYFSKEKVKLLK